MICGKTIKERCEALLSAERLDSEVLAQTLESLLPIGEPPQSMYRADPDRPYGRNVLMDSPALEVMIASWSRNHPCAPHDHGGSAGAVLVLQGSAVHIGYRLEEGHLEVVFEERKEAGEILCCLPTEIHSMADGGGELPLITLHLYTDAIENMVVYDEQAQQTYVVDGSCGAWAPVQEKGLLASASGIVSREDIIGICREGQTRWVAGKGH
jgi:hypothetical protein